MFYSVLDSCDCVLVVAVSTPKIHYIPYHSVTKC